MGLFTPIELKSMADLKQIENAVNFWNEFTPKLNSLLENQAKCGHYELTIRDSSEYNYYNWLSCKNLYDYAISELKKLGFDILHSDDVRDGTYIIIRW